MTCDKCGVELAIGMYPFCKGTPDGHAPSVHAIRPDTIIGGFWAENAWREPRYFDSQKKYEKALDESGLMLKPKKTHGAYPVTPETLAWAARRVAARTKTVEITERVLDETMTVTAEESA